MFNLRRLFLLLLTVVCSFSSLAEDRPSYSVATVADDIVAFTIFDAIGEHFNWDIEYISYENFSAAKAAVRVGDADFLANIVYTNTRAQYLDFSQPTNIDFTFLSTLDGSKTLADKHIVAVEKDTIYKKLLAAAFPHAVVVEYTTLSEAKHLLDTKQVDAVINSTFTLREAILSGLDTHMMRNELGVYPVAIAATKGKYEKFLKEISDFVIQSEVQQTLKEKIRNYHFALTKQRLRNQVLTSKLDVSKPLMVNLSPLTQFVHFHDDGRTDGISADLIVKICAMLQVKCQTANDQNDAWSELYQDLLQQKVDILTPTTITPERKAEFHFSDAYYSPQAILVKRNGYKDGAYHSVSELFNERIGLIDDYFLEGFAREYLPGKELHGYANESELAQALIDGDIDYMLIVRSTFNHYLRTSSGVVPLTEDKDLGVVYSYDVAFAFQHNERGELLADLFDRVMELIDLDMIIQQYDYAPDWYDSIKVQDNAQLAVVVASILAGAFLIYSIIFFYKKSITDELTQLKNRRAIYGRYGRSFPKTHTLVYLDVNKFKHINDTYGHAMGDEALKQLAENIRKHWNGDSYRIGGDEFILITNQHDQSLSEMLTTMKKYSIVDEASGEEIFVTVSIGIVEQLEQNLPLDKVLHQADQSMYQYKADTRDKPRFRSVERSE